MTEYIRFGGYFLRHDFQSLKDTHKTLIDQRSDTFIGALCQLLRQTYGAIMVLYANRNGAIVVYVANRW
jgi:hypothetical protein